MRLLSICLFVLVCAFCNSPPIVADIERHTLTIHVNGGKPNKGQVLLSLFNTKDNYMKAPIKADTQLMNMHGDAVFTITHLKTDTYAISVIYDENSNGKLDTGLFGIPKELVGFSNNVKGAFGPPDYHDAAFKLSVSKIIQIELKKAK